MWRGPKDERVSNLNKHLGARLNKEYPFINVKEGENEAVVVVQAPSMASNVWIVPLFLLWSPTAKKFLSNFYISTRY